MDFCDFNDYRKIVKIDFEASTGQIRQKVIISKKTRFKKRVFSILLLPVLSGPGRPQNRFFRFYFFDFILFYFTKLIKLNFLNFFKFFTNPTLKVGLVKKILFFDLSPFKGSKSLSNGGNFTGISKKSPFPAQIFLYLFPMKNQLFFLISGGTGWVPRLTTAH
jgi:hypothetical protein